MAQEGGGTAQQRRCSDSMRMEDLMGIEEQDLDRSLTAMREAGMGREAVAAALSLLKVSPEPRAKRRDWCACCLRLIACCLRLRLLSTEALSTPSV